MNDRMTRLDNNAREIWVDNVKVIACVLVVLGHFFQSMTQSGIIPANDFYYWFIQTVYFFHVQLFFICSGYLYQKYSCVNSVYSWRRNIIKKALSLGIPYFVFSFVTWFLKTVFAESVNNEIGGMFYTLFISPTSPYWYLYCLFFVFLITPTISKRKYMWTGLGCAIAFKIINLAAGGVAIYAVSSVAENEIWFVIGMCLAEFDFVYRVPKTAQLWGLMLSGIFIVLSILIYILKISFFGIGILMGLLGCGAVILFLAAYYIHNKQNIVMKLISKYTMPLFLMHTIFAAPVRIVLFKFGISNPGLHIIIGLIISFAGPIVAAKIMSGFRWLDFFLYPTKYIKLKV